MIDAATALRYLRDLPDGDVLVTAPHQRTTGITVADLRAMLVAAQWRDPSDPPAHSGPVQIETCDGLGVARYVDGTWDGIDAPLLREDVLRWRELLPR